MRRFVLSMRLHFACLVTFSWMQSQPAIHGFGSGFYEPETSHAHAKMLWCRWFHPNAVYRSVWHASVFLRFHLRCSIPGVNPMHRDNHTYAIRDFQTIFLAILSASRPVVGSLRIQDIALDSSIFLENSRRQIIEYDQVELFAA